MSATNRLGRLLAIALLSASLGACAGGSTATSTAPVPTPHSTSAGPTMPVISPEPTGASSPSARPSGSAQASSSAPPASIAGPAYDNPVFAVDFPDPSVLLVDGTYYAYSTNSANQNIPIASSPDLATWRRERDALPALPAWAELNFGNTWAPGVIQLDDSFVAYYVSRDKESNRQCIGVATTTSPLGPFTDSNDKPFVCQVDLGGSIDPYPFRDADGQLYLYWKNDGNCCAKPVGLWAQALSDDGLKLKGEATELIQRDQPWEIPLVENPAMVNEDGAYYLFYSANRWDTFEYAVGYATCETATGPCEKPLNGPVFKYTDEVFGPGGETFFTDTDGDLIMAYHAWPAPNVGYPMGQRMLYIDPVTFENGAPVIKGPTSDPQPLP